MKNHVRSFFSRFFSPVVFLLLPLAACSAQPPPTFSPQQTDALRQQLGALVRNFNGTAGIYVRHFGTGAEIALNADTLFPTASMIKIPILLKIFDKIERGELDYHQTLVYRDSLLYPGVDLLGAFKDGEEIELAKVMLLMMSLSDNTASLWLQHLAGTGTAINDWLDAHGFAHTRVNSRTPGRRGDWERYGWGQTTPREMARLLTMIYRGDAVSPAASEEMYRTLTRPYWNDEALSQLPPTVQAASKNGAVSQSRSEVVLVNAPGGAYVFCVITKNQQDTSWVRENEGFELIRAVSRLLWHHFEPQSNWQPAPGIEKYRE